MASINLANVASANSIDLSTNGLIFLRVDGLVSWVFDLVIDPGSTANGVVKIFTYCGPALLSMSPAASFSITNGSFANSERVQMVDANYTITAPHVEIQWVGSDLSDKKLLFYGIGIL